VVSQVLGVLTSLLLLSASSACDDRAQNPPRDRAAADHGLTPPGGASPAGGPPNGEDLERLVALGYLAGTDPAGTSHGVTRHDAERAAPGLNFFTSGHGPVAVLMDMDGVVLHEWRADFRKLFPEHRNLRNRAEPRRNFWRDAHLLPNGDIIAIWDLFGIFKLNRDSEIVSVIDPVGRSARLWQRNPVIRLRQSWGTPFPPATPGRFSTSCKPNPLKSDGP
jgi:hypothetical protein